MVSCRAPPFDELEAKIFDDRVGSGRPVSAVELDFNELAHARRLHGSEAEGHKAVLCPVSSNDGLLEKRGLALG